MRRFCGLSGQTRELCWLSIMSMLISTKGMSSVLRSSSDSATGRKTPFSIHTCSGRRLLRHVNERLNLTPVPPTQGSEIRKLYPKRRQSMACTTTSYPGHHHLLILMHREGDKTTTQDVVPFSRPGSGTTPLTAPGKVMTAPAHARQRKLKEARFGQHIWQLYFCRSGQNLSQPDLKTGLCA